MSAMKTPPPLKPVANSGSKPAWKSVLLFFLAAMFVGPLAAPILFKNENVSPAVRWSLTLGMIALTLYLVYFTYVTVDEQLAPVMEMMQQN